jgi:hypothetical protein
MFLYHVCLLAACLGTAHAFTLAQRCFCMGRAVKRDEQHVSRLQRTCLCLRVGHWSGSHGSLVHTSPVSLLARKTAAAVEGLRAAAHAACCLRV